MNIQVKILQSTPLDILVNAIRNCYQSIDKSDSHWCISKDLKSYNVRYFEIGPKDKDLISRVIESDHTSTLEHIVFSFDIKGISRLCLQELSRHRIASPSVQSTRYTLKELKNVDKFWWNDIQGFNNIYDWERAATYINLLEDPEDEEINIASIKALENLRQLVASGKYSNDKLKYCLPECYRLNEVLTINLRSLRNFLSLRLAPNAHFEIRELALKIKNCIPEDYNFLLT